MSQLFGGYVILGILKWLFSGSSVGGEHAQKGTRHESSGSIAAEPEPEPSLEIAQSSDASLPGANYYSQLERLLSSVSAKEYQSAAIAARASLPLLRAWLKDPRGEGKRLTIRIPALSQGGTMMAITEDREGLTELCNLVHDFDDLKHYREEAALHFADLDLFNQIREAVRGTPGIPQNQIAIELGLEDGRRASRLVSYLEKSGEIGRARNGKTYQLYLTGTEIPETEVNKLYTEPAKPKSHRLEMSAVRPRDLDTKQVSIVPLPPSPSAWEHSVDLPVAHEAFADPEGAWREIVVVPIMPDDRPDPAFRKHYSTRDGALSFDDLAKSDASSGAPGAVIFSNTRAHSELSATLRRDAYHISVHPEGEGFALRSKSNVLTIYNGSLEVDLETDLEAAPEVAASLARLGLAEVPAHRRLRCVALTPERDRYLFTHVDEAWCISREGQRLWGLRMPANDPIPIRVGSAGFGTATDIDEALAVMGLKLPVTPDEIRVRYRQLARAHHPDINSGSDETMKAVNVASERLTGLGPDQLAANGEIEIMISFGTGADWIYAAAFSGNGETALLGTYAGRVVRINRDGAPIAIYDVGSVPVRIIETEAYLYVMTATRLYVLDGQRLVALEDCSGKSDLLVCENHVLLVEARGVRVFTNDGRPLGIALAKAPIRRAYIQEGNLVIETRTQRAFFHAINPASERPKNMQRMTPSLTG